MIKPFEQNLYNNKSHVLYKEMEALRKKIDISGGEPEMIFWTATRPQREASPEAESAEAESAESLATAAAVATTVDEDGAEDNSRAETAAKRAWSK